MRILFILFTFFILLSCQKKQNHENEVIINSYQPNISQHLNETPFPLTSTDIPYPVYGGTVYNTNIKNDTNVYLLPNSESRIKEILNTGTFVRIIGISDNRENLENDEYWIKILYKEITETFEDPKTGWVLSSFTTIEKCNVSYLEIERSEINEWGNFILHGKYNINGVIREFSISTNKVENQDFYTFSWDYTSEGFHHSNKPGVYIWRVGENEPQHITYAGGEGEKWAFSSWSIVTDDFKYLLEDRGTNIPPRGVTICNLENGEEIFIALYYLNINLKGHTIEIVRFYKEYYNGRWSENVRGNLTNEEIIFANKFMSENEPSEYFRGKSELVPNSFGLLIVYEYNIDTEERKIVRGEYCPTH